MAFATIVNFIVITFGENATMTSWVFWWMDAILSLVTNFGILFSLFAFQTQSLDTMTAGWLLAAVTTIVSSVGYSASYRMVHDSPNCIGFGRYGSHLS